MAQVTVCDVCGSPLSEKDTEPINVQKPRYGYVRVSILVNIFDKDNKPNDWKNADVCRYCLTDALRSVDDRPQPGCSCGVAK